MGELVTLIVLLILFILVGIVLGIIAFVKVRRLERLVIEIKSSLSKHAAAREIIVDSDQLPSAAKDPINEPEDELRAAIQTAANITQDNISESKEIPLEQNDAGENVPETLFESEDKFHSDNDEIFKPVSDEVSKPRRNLEETIGSLWAVWVGGAAFGSWCDFSG